MVIYKMMLFCPTCGFRSRKITHEADIAHHEIRRFDKKLANFPGLEHLAVFVADLRFVPFVNAERSISALDLLIRLQKTGSERHSKNTFLAVCYLKRKEPISVEPYILIT